MQGLQRHGGCNIWWHLGKLGAGPRANAQFHHAFSILWPRPVGQKSLRRRKKTTSAVEVIHLIHMFFQNLQFVTSKPAMFFLLESKTIILAGGSYWGFSGYSDIFCCQLKSWTKRQHLDFNKGWRLVDTKWPRVQFFNTSSGCVPQLVRWFILGASQHSQQCTLKMVVGRQSFGFGRIRLQ